MDNLIHTCAYRIFFTFLIMVLLISPAFDFFKIFTVLIFLLKNQVSKQEDSLSVAIIEAEARGVQAEVVEAASKGVLLILGLT